MNLDELHEADASTMWYADGTLVCVAPSGNVFDCYTPQRAALIVALRNAYADGTLVPAAKYDSLVEAARNARTVVAEYIDESGGCDHSVNICMCGEQQILDDLDAALKEVRP